MTSSVRRKEHLAGAAPTTTPLLELQQLETSFPTPRGLVRAVDGISLKVHAGECVGIVGESGSGKSVLVRTVMNLLPPTAVLGAQSRVLLDGEDLASLSPQRRKHLWGPELAMVFQDPMTSLNPVRRVGDQIADPQRFHLGRSRKEARESAVELLTQVGISEPQRRLDQYPHELSGGMRQRVMIAIALACEPRVLIADEPTTALDVTVQRQILELLRGLQRDRGMAMVLITHDLGVVAGHTDRVAVMYAGRLVESAPTRVLFGEMGHRYTEALFRSTPRVEQPTHSRLEVIAGRPPDLVALPAGCRFAPRCTHAVERCATDLPQLEPQAHEHLLACHNPVARKAS
ncbi:ABC transporter ATP-binding protein [Pseudonocardia lutea]|uniref:ABC transporter ATP-binding protein n=1 Tax=Pseudonocardia lutea TaxID=2172015 RepID=A0ABW1IAU5_9PSEU